MPHPVATTPPLAIKLRSGRVLSAPDARWHSDLLLQAGIPEEQWEAVVAASGFLDPHGHFVAGHGARLLAGRHYFREPPELPCPEAA